jgi:glutaredoxin 3
MEKKVRIYTTSSCHYCAQAKAYFTEKGIEFETVDVTSDAAALTEMKRLTGGARSVPVIVVNGEVIIGFDLGAVEKALQAREQG